jgi:tight adherence protein C
MEVILIGIGFGVFAALGLAVFLYFGDQSTVEARLAQVTTSPIEQAPFGLREFLASVTQPLMPFRQLLRGRGQEDLAYRLSLAGFRQPQDIDTFLNAKLLCPVLGVLIATFTGGSNVLPAGLVLAAAGFFAPDFFLSYARNKRKLAISRGLPSGIDLLVMCVEAGLGIDQAIIRVADEMKKSSRPLSEELALVAREQRAGRPRVEAWRNMADRVALDTLRHFAGMLTQSERLGTPVARALSNFADNLRSTRLLEAEERAAKTSTKLLFPLILFIFPAMFIVILGPAVIALADAFNN